MNHFNSIRELLNTLSKGDKLIAEMIEKRKLPAYRCEYAVELMDNYVSYVILNVEIKF